MGLFAIIALTAMASTHEAPLNVEFNIIPPMAYGSATEGYKGFDIELWNKIADDNGWEYTLSEVNPRRSRFNDLEQNRCSVLIGGVSLTSDREEKFDTTVPYMTNKISIATKTIEHKSIVSVVIENSGLWKSLIILVIMLIVFSHCIWLAEKTGENEHHDCEGHIDERYIPGIFEAFWLAWVSTATIGYGDYVARRWLGRIATIVCTTIAFVLFANLLASLAAFKVQQATYTPKFETIADLNGKKIGIIANTTSERARTILSAEFVEFDNVPAMHTALMNDDVDAIVHDSASINHFIKENPNVVVSMANISHDQYYGFLVPKDSPLREQINRSILKLQENGELESLYSKWFAPAP